MERQVPGVEMNMDLGMAANLTTDGSLSPLSLEAMETLLAALDPRLDGFGEGPSCLDDARAYLNRLASCTGKDEEENREADTAIMAEWIETWRAAGGNRQTLRLLVQTLLAERLGKEGEEPSAKANESFGHR